mmetsp:Transcript_53998/g.155900  ORF Transcript_53998/g.155900 Transcript_53998/m.155900 type:complete len:270 (+) Transcript_53998:87-896(+)
MAATLRRRWSAVLLLGSLDFVFAERQAHPTQDHLEPGAFDGVASEGNEAAGLEALLKTARDRDVSAGDEDVDPSLLVRLEHLYAQADLEDNGDLDPDEAARIMAPFEEDTALFDDLVDPDELRVDESLDIVADMFRALDVNGDGRIDLQEMLDGSFWDDDPNMLRLVRELFEKADEKDEGSLGKEGVEIFVELLRDSLPDDGYESAVDDDFDTARQGSEGSEESDETEEFYSAFADSGDAADFSMERSGKQDAARGGVDAEEEPEVIDK